MLFPRSPKHAVCCLAKKLRYCQNLVHRWKKAQACNILFILEEANNIKIQFIVIIKSKYLK